MIRFEKKQGVVSNQQVLSEVVLNTKQLCLIP